MKITIEWDSSTEAKIVVDGREMKVSCRPGETRLTMADGTKVPDMTFGGFIGEKLYSTIADLMQAKCVVSDYVGFDDGRGTWEEYPEECEEEIQDIVW